MPKVARAYFDTKGGMHRTLEDATLADLAAVIGNISPTNGLTAGVARLLIEKRTEIEAVFAAHDQIATQEKEIGNV